MTAPSTDAGKMRALKRENKELKEAVADFLCYLGPWLEDFDEDSPQYQAYKRLMIAAELWR